MSPATQASGLFECPTCTIPLDAAGHELRCSQCTQAWPVIDGVPRFVQNFPYWGEVSIEEIREVNQRARDGNWKEALLNHPSENVQRASRMMLNLDRANWHLFAKVPPTARVLDLGAGTGTTSHALARVFKEVVALEPVDERVEFMRHRFQQENLSNVTVVQSSLWTLPFPKQSFDLIVMNGVLEWVPLGVQGDPRELQLRAMRNAFDLLKPGGCLYIGIENRAAAGHFIGYNDPHCGLPWVPILPRPLAHWYARRKGQDGYRNYLYTSFGYRKLFRDAGFSSIDIYLALPSYNDPRFLIPMTENVHAYHSATFGVAPARSKRSLVRQVLVKLRLAKYLEYSYAILGYRP